MTFNHVLRLAVCSSLAVAPAAFAQTTGIPPQLAPVASLLGGLLPTGGTPGGMPAIPGPEALGMLIAPLAGAGLPIPGAGGTPTAPALPGLSTLPLIGNDQPVGQLVIAVAALNRRSDIPSLPVPAGTFPVEPPAAPGGADPLGALDPAAVPGLDMLTGLLMPGEGGTPPAPEAPGLESVTELLTGGADGLGALTGLLTPPEGVPSIPGLDALPLPPME